MSYEQKEFKAEGVQMNTRLTKLIQRRPWALLLAAGVTLVEILLAALWLQDRSRDWAEPALLLFGVLMLLFGVPSLKDLLFDDSEQKLAEQVVTYLENKGILFVSVCYEHPSDCHNSASEVRDDLTELMREMDRDTVVFNCTDRIRLRCASFMRELERLGAHRTHYSSELSTIQEVQFKQLITSLREDCSQPIAEISAAFHVVVRGDLAAILPSQHNSVRLNGGDSPNQTAPADG
jgi:hypothetical protein